MEAINSHIKVAERIILEVFSFLKTEGYIPNSDNLKSDVFIEQFEICYINDSIKREIAIHYAKGNTTGQIRYTFTLSITRLPYSGVKDFLALSTFLSSIGMDFDTSMINDFDSEKTRLILEQMTTAMKNHLWQVIKGERWLEGYYPEW